MDHRFKEARIRAGLTATAAAKALGGEGAGAVDPFTDGGAALLLLPPVVHIGKGNGAKLHLQVDAVK